VPSIIESALLLPDGGMWGEANGDGRGLTSTRGTGPRRRVLVRAGGFPGSGDFLEIHPIRPDRPPLANDLDDRCLIGMQKSPSINPGSGEANCFASGEMSNLT